MAEEEKEEEENEDMNRFCVHSVTSSFIIVRSYISICLLRVIFTSHFVSCCCQKVLSVVGDTKTHIIKRYSWSNMRCANAESMKSLGLVSILETEFCAINANTTTKNLVRYGQKIKWKKKNEQQHAERRRRRRKNKYDPFMEKRTNDVP